MAARNAASVLPDPVGAAISVCLPSAIDAHPCAWAAVGSPSAVWNHCWTSGWKRAKDMLKFSQDVCGSFRVSQSGGLAGPILPRSLLAVGCPAWETYDHFSFRW